MSTPSHYEVLGVGRTATPEEIRKAYKKLCLDCHPDRNPGDPDAEDRFKQVSAAYQTLSDPKRRKMYDVSGKDEVRNPFVGHQGANFQDAIRTIFNVINDYVDDDDEDWQPPSEQKKRPPKASPICDHCGDTKRMSIRQGAAIFIVPCPHC
jgi:DnaJ-class molecular chaperone